MKELSDYLKAAQSWKVVWSCAGTTPGGLYVMINGQMKMLEWCVDN